MKVVVLHSGPLSEIVVASSVCNGIKKQPEDIELTWVVPDNYSYIFKYNKNINRTISFEKFSYEDQQYDLLINLWPSEIKTNAKINRGFEYLILLLPYLTV